MSLELAQARRDLERARERFLTRHYRAAAMCLSRALMGKARR